MIDRPELPAAPDLPLSIGGLPVPLARIDPAALPPMSQPVERAWAALHQVLDPEVPALSVCDLGIVREVRYESGTLEVWLTPTYSGCPATEAIVRAVRLALAESGFESVQVHQRRAPAWTTDWISPQGRAKLKAYGIAPPAHLLPDGAVPIRVVRGAASTSLTINCPRCDSAHTERLSAFGSTACKSLWRCRACGEPFEHFKPI